MSACPDDAVRTSVLCLQDLVASGPIPWASYSSACYIAEQVSHHPPGVAPTHSDYTHYSTTRTHTHTHTHTVPLCTVLTPCLYVSSFLAPVSAFYAECPATGVCVLGSLQTKPKFMGLSVSIVNTGNVYITIPKLGEVYTMNIPHAYGR